MAEGLVHETDGSGPSVTATATSTGSQAGGNSNAAGGAGASVTTTTTTTGSAATDYADHGTTEPELARNVNSHLDSWFRRRAMTREDVLVMASIAQVGLWLVLIYIEVSE